MLTNTEIYFISWIEILETETIYRMEKCSSTWNMPNFYSMEI